MKDKGGSIIVPWDFTKVADNAMEHAIKLSKILDCEIELLHIVDPKTDDSRIKEKSNSLEDSVEYYTKKHKISLNKTFLKGNIFNTISEYAESKQAMLIIMGTHGIKGMQRIKGSNAYRVMFGSKVPYLTVKDKPAYDSKISTLLVPIDFKEENIEKMESVIFFAQKLSAKIYIYKPALINKSQVKQTNVNLHVAEKLLTDNNIDFEVHTAKRTSRFFAQTIEFGKQINADIIQIVTTKHKLKDYFRGEHEQYIIDNKARIPVMCVNPTKEL
jgi:nucleotide-binding universal stress UspA family protein